MSTKLIVAIDGPAAAGKGTLARRLAGALGLPYLDTGLLYRATARRVLDAAGDPADPVAAEAHARALTPDDLERADLRTPAVDQAAASVASLPGVRAALLSFQRQFGQARGAVLDGRDIGTVIFPDARVKLFVTASVAARAERRWKELAGRGIAVSLQSVTDDLEERDAADASRAAAPLRPAADAVILDTTSLGADQAFQRACEIIDAIKKSAGPAPRTR
jgi:cytidylate kinase